MWTVANLLTGIRLLLIPPFLYYVVRGDFGIALLLFLIAAITDSADGYVARRFHQQTVLGRLMDPLADKLLTGSAYIVMAIPRDGIPTIPIWLAAAVVSRDVFILLGVAVVYARTGFRQFKPTSLGKRNTFLELCVIVLFLTTHSFNRMTVVMPPFYFLVAASLGLSTLGYLGVGLRTLRNHRRSGTAGQI